MNFTDLMETTWGKNTAILFYEASRVLLVFLIQVIFFVTLPPLLLQGKRFLNLL